MRERIEELLIGAVDFHVHVSPDPISARILGTSPERSCTVTDAVLGAEELGMGAIVLKSHDYPTTPFSMALEDMVEEIKIVGSVTLNYAVGGINPYAVETCGRAGGRVVWMPTFSSMNEMRRRGMEGGIYILDERGNPKKEVMDVLSIIKELDMVLCTSHLSREEIYSLVREARKMKIEKVVITHPMTTIAGTPLTIEEQKELSDMGAFIEHCFAATMPLWGGLHPGELVRAIREVGAQRCILSTDLGQVSNPVPWEGMRMMVGVMLSAGLTDEEMRLLIRDNPRKLLSLE